MYDEFFGIEESEQYAFYRVPKLLFTTDRFWNLSTDAKISPDWITPFPAFLSGWKEPMNS